MQVEPLDNSLVITMASLDWRDQKTKKLLRKALYFHGETSDGGEILMGDPS